MTVDIARANGNALATLGGASEALARLGEWVQAASHAHQLVAPLIDTAFIPDAYKPRVSDRASDKEKEHAREVAIANATAAVLQGITLGMDPLVSMQQIYIVHGRPGMYAKMMVALVQSHGHDVWTEDLSDSRAVVCGRRKGKDYTERITITMDQARKAGWTKNDTYTKTPQDMLWARAASRVCDRIASDVLKGLASVEEIQDTIQVEATVGNGTRTVTPRQRALPPAAPAVEPPLEPEPQTPAPPAQAATAASVPPVEGITPTQSRKLHALLKATDRADKDFALAHIVSLIDRSIDTTKDLTAVEADEVIAALLEEKAEIEAANTVAAEPEPALDGELWPDTATPAGQ